MQFSWKLPINSAIYVTLGWEPDNCCTDNYSTKGVSILDAAEHLSESAEFTRLKTDKVTECGQSLSAPTTYCKTALRQDYFCNTDNPTVVASRSPGEC
jgi:hypothetical protein